MRVAALYDIHGNLPALEAVVEDTRDARVDLLVIGGDVVPGPMVRETLEYLLGLDIPTTCIRGNCEVALLAEMAGLDPGPMPEQARSVMRWTARQLTGEHARLLEAWPRTITLEIGRLGTALFCHATPRDENEIVTRLTPGERLLEVYEGLGADVAVCGHTHMQFDRRAGGTRVVNAGSVGMPFGEPGADWLLLGPDVQLRHTLYDLESAAQRICETDYPGAREFAERCVVHPPSESEMLEAYTR